MTSISRTVDRKRNSRKRGGLAASVGGAELYKGRENGERFHTLYNKNQKPELLPKT